MKNRVTQNFLVALWLLFLAGLAPELPAQKASSHRLTVAVNVLDRGGNFVRGLTSTNFSGKLGRKDVKIVSVTLDNQPRRIVILLDVSGSMIRQKGRWKLAYRAAWDIIALAPAESSLALLVFAETVEDTGEFTQEREAVLQRLSALGPDYQPPKSYRRTALNDAILEAVALLTPPQVGDVIYLITDGGENSSRTRGRRARRALLCAGVRLFAFVLLSPGQTSTRYVARVLPSFVKWLQATGGGGVILGSTSELRAEYRMNDKRQAQIAERAYQLYHRMGEFYRLEVELPRALRKPRGWKLEVVDEHGEKRKVLKVIYPRRLAACPVENLGN